MALSRRTHYLQIALNASLSDAQQTIRAIGTQPSGRVLYEIGTPMIKTYGLTCSIQAVHNAHWIPTQPQSRRRSAHESATVIDLTSMLSKLFSRSTNISSGANTQHEMSADNSTDLYIVADLKCMDRGETEASLAAAAGAHAATALGRAPIQTLNAFIGTCKDEGIDSFIDMMGVDKPWDILRRLARPPTVVMLHRGVDEQEAGVGLPIHLINKIKGTLDVMIAVAGGDTPREIQSSVFNGADIVVVWKDFYEDPNRVAPIVGTFLSTIK